MKPEEVTPEMCAFAALAAYEGLPIAACIAAAINAMPKSDAIAELERECDALKAERDELKEDAERMRSALEHMADVLRRQLNLIDERAKGDYLDKVPIMRALRVHEQHVISALQEPKP